MLVVADGGVSPVHDLRRHRTVGQEQAGAESRVQITGFWKKILDENFRMVIKISFFLYYCCLAKVFKRFPLYVGPIKP